MTVKINGSINNGENLTGDIDFWTVYTAAAIEAGTDVNEATPGAADNLDRIVQFIGQRAQAVMVSVASDATVTNATAAPYSFGSQFDNNPTTVYTLKFATEHSDAWTDVASEVNNLAESIDGLPLPFETAYAGTAPAFSTIDTSSGTVKNTTVVKSLTL